MLNEMSKRQMPQVLTYVWNLKQSNSEREKIIVVIEIQG
jgi:hypothetical protein